jgi:cell division GTPase FtsZ
MKNIKEANTKMIKVKVIGVGAAGGKAVIEAINQEAISRENCMILNSTSRDVPQEYIDIYHQFKESPGGCGKNRALAKELMVNSLETKSLDLSTWIEKDDLTVIVGSTEGGTGSGAIPELARSIYEDMDDDEYFNVHIYALIGFEDDVKGIQNTVNFFKEIVPGIAVEATSNKKFLDGTGNRKTAEQAANIEFAERLKILQGLMIVESEQNIDKQDLTNLSTYPGYMQIEHIKLDEKIKNPDQFNQIVNDMLDDSKSLDTTPSAFKLGIILNAEEKTLNHIDNDFKVIKDRLGFPLDLYIHKQYVGTEEYMCIISSGMKMPMDEVMATYERYRTQSSYVDKSNDNFFNTIGDLEDDPTDVLIDSRDTNRRKKNKNKQPEKHVNKTHKKESEMGISMGMNIDDSKF